MQLIATELCRNTFGSDIWVNVLKKQIDKEWSKNKVIIDDVRFKSEYEAFKKESISIRIIRPDFEIIDQHSSEHELDEVVANHTIYNNGSLDDLYEMVDKIMSEIDFDDFN